MLSCILIYFEVHALVGRRSHLRTAAVRTCDGHSRYLVRVLLRYYVMVLTTTEVA